MRHALLLFAASILTLTGAGCVATSAELRFKAIKPVNMAAPGGESRVVEVRVYQLKDRTKFEESATEAIWDDAAAALGGDLLGTWIRGEPVYPSEPGAEPIIARAKIEHLEQETRYIGVLALMDKKDEVDRRHVAVAVGEAGSVMFTIKQYHIEIER